MSALLWLLCITAMTAALLIAPHPAVLAALALFAAVPVCSWLILFLVRRTVRVSFAAPGVVGKNRPFTLYIRMESNSRIPFGKTVIWLQLTNAVTGETQKKRIAFRGSGEWVLQSAYCGCIECRAAGVWCCDLFGILPVRIPCKAKKRITVMPDTFSVTLQTELTHSDQDDCAEYAPNQKGSDRTETMQIREYDPGDPLQQIHWKLSGKLDRLIVRDPAQPVDRTLMVFLEQTDGNRSPETADALMEAVVSVCQALAETNQPFRLVWNEDVIVAFDVGNFEQLPEAVSALLKARRNLAKISGSDLYQKTRGDGDMGAVLYFCSALPDDPFPAAKTQVFLCGEGDRSDAVEFTPQNMTEVLANLSWS